MPLLEPDPTPEPEPKHKKRKSGRGTDKPMTFTAVARGGEVRLTPILSHGTANLAVPVLRWVDPSAVLATDELPAYFAIGRRHGGHIRVNHSAGEYARPDARTGLRAHVNTAESVHAMFKRALVGVFPRKSLRDFAGVNGKHMGRYLREVEFRWNHRTGFEQRLTSLFASKAVLRFVAGYRHLAVQVARVQWRQFFEAGSTNKYAPSNRSAGAGHGQAVRRAARRLRAARRAIGARLRAGG